MLDSPELQSALVQLGQLAIRNSAASVATRVSAFRVRRDRDEVINELIELVNELTSEKAQLIGIGQALESQIATQKITDDEIRFINEKLIPTVERLIESPAGSTDSDEEEAGRQNRETLNVVRELVSVETLTVLQLVGFNYKEAIGQPLTELLASVIRAQIQKPDDAVALQTANLQLQAATVALAQDPAAFDRFRQLMT